MIKINIWSYKIDDFDRHNAWSPPANLLVRKKHDGHCKRISGLLTSL